MPKRTETERRARDVSERLLRRSAWEDTFPVDDVIGIAAKVFAKTLNQFVSQGDLNWVLKKSALR